MECTSRCSLPAWSSFAENAGDATCAMHVGRSPIRRTAKPVMQGTVEMRSTSSVNVGGLRHGEDVQHGVGGAALAVIHASAFETLPCGYERGSTVSSSSS